MVPVASSSEKISTTKSSRFFSRHINSDTSSASSSSEDELIMEEMEENGFLTDSINELCEKIETLFNVSSITVVRWPSVQKGIEDLQKNLSSISNTLLIEETLVNRIGKLFILLEDSLQTSKSTGGGAGSAGVAAKQASLLASRLPKLKPTIITPSLLATLRMSSKEEKDNLSSLSSEEENNKDGSENESENGYSSNSYSSDTSSEENSGSDDDQTRFSRGTTSAADKWKKKDPIPSTFSSTGPIIAIKKQVIRSTTRKQVGDDLLSSMEHLSKEEEDELENYDIALTPEGAMKKYSQVLAFRGRKGADRLGQIETLERLSAYNGLGVVERIKIKLTLASFYFERAPSTSSVTWITMLLNLLSEMVKLGLESKGIIFSVNSNNSNPLIIDNTSENVGGGLSLILSLLASVQRLDDEYNNLLLHSPSPSSTVSESSTTHSLEYADLLRLEKLLYYLLVNTQWLCHSLSKTAISPDIQEALYDLAVRRLNHLYAKSEKGILKLEYGLTASCNDQEDSEHILDMTMIEATSTFSPISLLELAGEPSLGLQLTFIPASLRLTSFILFSPVESISQNFRARALLYLISWITSDGSSFSIASKSTSSKAISPFLVAKGLLLASSLADSITWADIPTQVLYNRSLAMLGLAAFREGRLRACMGMLGELVGSGRCRELLGQAQGSSMDEHSSFRSVTMMGSTTLLMPWHTWISIESLEITFLLASVLVEIPTVVTRSGPSGHAILPKSLRRLLGERPILSHGAEPGPGVSSKDILAGMARFILAGDWRAAYGLIPHLRLPSTAANMLLSVKEASFISLLGKNFRSWTSLHIPSFAAFFELETVRALELIRGWISDSTAKQGVSFDTPFIDEGKSQEWLYAHEIFSANDQSSVSCSFNNNITNETPSSSLDKYSIWTAKLQVTSVAQVLSERLSLLIQENEKLSSKRTGACGSSSSYQRQHTSSTITKSK